MGWGEGVGNALSHESQGQAPGRPRQQAVSAWPSGFKWQNLPRRDFLSSPPPLPAQAVVGGGAGGTGVSTNLFIAVCLKKYAAQTLPPIV